MSEEVKDQVFRDPSVKDQDVWRVMLNGRLLPIEWNSKGAAEAGLIVERDRESRRAK